MKATEHGRKLIASDDFANTLSMIVLCVSQKDLPYDEVMSCLRVYTAMSLATDADGLARMETRNDEEEMCQFITEHGGAIDAAIHRVAEMNVMAGIACGAISSARA